VEPSAVAARRTRASLALAAGGAIVLMAGVALLLTGEAMKLGHPARLPPLIVPGLILVILGFALGASAAVTILLDVPSRLPYPPPGADVPGDRAGAGPAPGGPARPGETVPGEVLSSFRLPDRPGGLVPGPARPAAPTEIVPGAALAPPVPAAREPLAGEAPPGPWVRPGPPAPGPPVPWPPAPGAPAAGPPVPWPAAPGAPAAGPPQGSAWPEDRPPGGSWPEPPPADGGPGPGDGPVGYSDAGWDAAADDPRWPDPPAEPPHEIHHPVRR
jgi:hypothetical protein